jgi:hypothetical protein
MSELLVLEAAKSRPASNRPSKSLGEALMDWPFDLAWFFPGVTLIVLALLVFGSDIVLAIGIVALLGGGGLKFGDFVWWLRSVTRAASALIEQQLCLARRRRLPSPGETARIRATERRPTIVARPLRSIQSATLECFADITVLLYGSRTA